MKSRSYKMLLTAMMMTFALLVGMAIGAAFVMFRATAAGAAEPPCIDEQDKDAISVSELAELVEKNINCDCPSDDCGCPDDILLVEDEVVKEFPGRVGGKDWGYSPPTIEKVILVEGKRLYIICRQYPLFSYDEEQPPDHVFRAVLHVVDNELRLVDYQEAEVTPPQEIPERIEWPPAPRMIYMEEH